MTTINRYSKVCKDLKSSLQKSGCLMNEIRSKKGSMLMKPNIIVKKTACLINNVSSLRCYG
ncbi:hypothetical protein C4Q31_08220 [Leptospira borgpetersenii serovar Ceylonica]|nr:hypothetical protein C4Q31_08220 [Leptospira borgpetersenii serovar Ceylonica]